MATPFSVPAPQDPAREAALTGLRARNGAPEPQPQLQASPGQGTAPGPPGQNPVSALLLQVLDLLVTRQGAPGDFEAVQQFIGSLEQIIAGATGQQPGQGQPAAQVGAAPPGPPIPQGPPPGGGLPPGPGGPGGPLPPAI